MKRLLALLLTLLLIPAAMAESSPYYIDGLDADRVHLRKAPSTAAESLGLYYTGTEVTVVDWYDEWAQVVIGEASGYMMSRFLTGEQVSCVGPLQMVDDPSGNGVNLREKPAASADNLSFPDNGITVRVLGETSDGWSYVVCEGVQGYVRTAQLSPVALKTTIVAAGMNGYIHRCIAPNGQELYFNAYEEEPIFELVDVNFDGLEDLVVITGRWAKCDTALFYVYDPAEGYVLVRETARDEGLMNYVLYPEYGLVGTSIANGNAGLCYEECLYRWEGNDLECIRRAYGEEYTESVWKQEYHTVTTWSDQFVYNVYDYTTGVPEGEVIYSAGPLGWDAFPEAKWEQEAALWQGLK